MSILIRVGSIRVTKKSKQELLWEVHRLLGKSKKAAPNVSLFEFKSQNIDLPPLDYELYEEAYSQIELLGFPLCSPFDLLEEDGLLIARANQIMDYLGKQFTIVGYLVTVKNTRTSKGSLMQFGTFVDQEGDWIDTVHFPPTVKQYPFRGKGCYSIIGKVVEEFGYPTIEVSSMKRLDYLERGNLVKETPL